MCLEMQIIIIIIMLYAWACGRATCSQAMLPTATQFTAPSASCQASSYDPMPMAVLVDVDLLSVGHMLKWTAADWCWTMS